MGGPLMRGQSVEAALRHGADVLAASPTPALDARVLMKHLLDLDDSGLIARGRDVLPDAALRAYEALVARRAAHEPVAYITGEKEFWSLSFHVSADVLIPRDDSECLIEAAIARRGRDDPALILDLGTGSGCLLCALLAEFPQADGVGVDRSEAALAIAKANAARLGLGGRTRFVAGDWGGALADRALGGGFDIVIANPPYIREDARDSLSPGVVAYEPSGALFAGADGLDAYRAVLCDISRFLGENGLLVVEIGEDQSDDVANMVSKSLPNAAIDIVPDLAGRPRGVVADGRSRSTER